MSARAGKSKLRAVTSKYKLRAERQGWGTGKYEYLKVLFVRFIKFFKNISKKELSLYKFIDVRVIASYEMFKSYPVV